MGKKVIRASVWTCRSLLSLYSKAIAMVFAVFCVVSGLSAGIKDEEGEKKTIRGKVYWKGGLTLARDLKLFMGEHAICPLYGVSSSCHVINIVDSVVTDSLGNFETAYPESLFKQETGSIIFAQYDSDYKISENPIAISDLYELNSNSDTSIVIYLHPNDANGIRQEKKPISVPLTKMISDNTVSLKIGNWSGGNNYSAKIIDITGKLVSSQKISEDGILRWNTERLSRGVYLINVETAQGLLSTKIALK